MPTLTRTRKMIYSAPRVQTGADWRVLALCAEVDPAIFFPESGESWAAAKRICSGCVVRVACLKHALDTREAHGVWGGTTPRERSRLLAGAGPGLTRTAPRPQRRHKCNHGHLLDGENLRIRPDGGGRTCRQCAREYKLTRRVVR